MYALSPGRVLTALCVVGGLAGCATVTPQPEVANACEQEQTLSARGSARPMTGFPGLATQRFLAGVLREQAADWSPDQWEAWLARSRAVALHDGAPAAGEPARDQCVRLTAESMTATQRKALVHAASVGTEYSTTQRLLGVYPLTGIGLRMGITGYQKESQEAWENYEPPPANAEGFLAYAVPAVSPEQPARSAASLRAAPRDSLGIPVVSRTLASALAQDFAPAFLLQTSGAFDLPGRPLIDGVPTVDAERPTLSWRLDYTLVHGVVLPQISWVLWFSERPPEGEWDAYSGRLDGLVWRATFGPDGWPVAYDTIHPCGCFHMVFPTRHKALDPGGSFWDEARLQPLAPAQWAQVALVVESRTHFLRAVVRGDTTPRSAVTLALEPWQKTRPALASAIDPHGVIAGTERLERYWLWPSGVRSPGAMRDWGRHATAFIGQQHFDDLRVLEPYLAPSVVARPAPP